MALSRESFAVLNQPQLLRARQPGGSALPREPLGKDGRPQSNILQPLPKERRDPIEPRRLVIAENNVGARLAFTDALSQPDWERQARDPDPDMEVRMCEARPK
jgi:hypothetical protein